MSFQAAVIVLLAIAVFVLAATMANLLARITVLERRLGGDPIPLPVPDLPARARSLLDPTGGGLLVFISRDCDTCDDIVDRLASWPLEARRRSRLVFWGQPRDDFVAPAGVRILADASDLYTDLGITRTPWYVEVADGAVHRQGLGLPAANDLVQPAPGGP